MNEVIVLIGAGSIGQAIARRVSAGKRLLVADLREDNANAAAQVLGDAGFDASTAVVDVSSRASVHALVEKATALGSATGVIHAAGVSPTQAAPATILKVDLYGTAVVLEEFGDVIAAGGSGVVISSQSGRRLPALPAEQNKALALTPADELLKLDFLQPDKVTDPLHGDRMMRIGRVLAALSGLVVAVDAHEGWGGLMGLVVPLFLFVSATGLIVANSIAGALGLFPRFAGSVSALIGAMQYGAGIFGSALVGAWSDGTPASLGLVIGLSGIGSLPSVALLSRQRHGACAAARPAA